MPYQTQLDFLRSVLEKCRLQLLLVEPDASVDFRVDLELRRILGLDLYYPEDFYQWFHQAKQNIIYRLTDRFHCSYQFFLLPKQGKTVTAVLGPYLTRELSHEQLLEGVEPYNIAPAQFRFLERYFSEVPVLTGDNPLFMVLSTFADTVWGKDAYAVEEIEVQAEPKPTAFFAWEDPPAPEETAWNIHAVEQRYAHENELIRAVAAGQIHKAEMLLSGFNDLAFERRVSDPVRNLKNYGIIMNTLLRKAAEIGGVHPLYLDRASSQFARRIELITATQESSALMAEMFRSYCGLVREHAVRDYPPAVQKCLLHIQMNLSDDLSLSALAKRQGINPSYLSDLFRREVGQTVTEYVTDKRIEHAKYLLRITKLQVQTVAQHCGIPDVNYFSKIFKRSTGRTPKQYRKEREATRTQ